MTFGAVWLNRGRCVEANELKRPATKRSFLACGADAQCYRNRLLDYLIRPLQQRLRDGQPEGLGGLEVDDQCECGGLVGSAAG